jgi:membrane-associated phospholipid phosphatase
MRNAEWINLLFFCAMGGFSLLRPLRRSKRTAVLVIGALGAGVSIAAQYADHLLSPLAASIIRDWLPAPLILAAYHQGGQFFSRAMEPLQSALVRIDQRLFTLLKRLFTTNEVPRSLGIYLEVAYAFCYPFVPMGVGVLYLSGFRDCVDGFWAIVLPPTYLCYAMIPFLPTLPPWQLCAAQTAGAGAGGVRGANFFILRHLSIKANTFPSAHVAASMATALALIHFVPAAGLAFLWVAVSIAVSTVAGRYHYVLDAVFGAALAAAAFALATSL